MKNPPWKTSNVASVKEHATWTSSQPSAGSSFKNKGVQLVLDGVVDYLPSPIEVKPQPEVDLEGNPTGEFAIVDANRPLRALAFKIMDDKYGALTFTRIYSGVLKNGDTILNTFTGKTERVGRMVEMNADDANCIDFAHKRATLSHWLA